MTKYIKENKKCTKNQNYINQNKLQSYSSQDEIFLINGNQKSENDEDKSIFNISFREVQSRRKNSEKSIPRKKKIEKMQDLIEKNIKKTKSWKKQKKFSDNFTKIKNFLICLLNRKKEEIVNNPNFRDFPIEIHCFLYYFLHRKMNKNTSKRFENFANLDLKKRIEKLEKKITKFKKFNSNKRQLENSKYWFSLFIKNCKENIECKEISKHSEIKKAKYIYELYFGKINENEKLPLKTKIFNKKYYDFIKKSKKFVDQFEIFINTKKKNIDISKVKEKIDNIWKKILDLFCYPEDGSKRFKDILKKNFNEILINQKQISLNNIIFEYLINYSNCKLPWSLSEIIDSSDKVKEKLFSF